MPTPALFLIIATLIPLASFTLLVFVGKRMGNPLAGYVGTAAIGISFVLSILAMMSWYHRGEYRGVAWGFERGAINLPMQWIPVGIAGNPNGIAQDHPGFLDIGV